MIWYPLNKSSMKSLYQTITSFDDVKKNWASDAERRHYTDETRSNIIWDTRWGNYSPKLKSSYTSFSLSWMSQELMRRSTDKMCRSEATANTRHHVTGKEIPAGLIKLTCFNVVDRLRDQTATYSWFGQQSVRNYGGKNSTGKTGSGAGPPPWLALSSEWSWLLRWLLNIFAWRDFKITCWRCISE